MVLTPSLKCGQPNSLPVLLHFLHAHGKTLGRKKYQIPSTLSCEKSYREKGVECSVERNFLLGPSVWRKSVFAFPAHECGTVEHKWEI